MSNKLLLLLSGQDLPFIGGKVNIHQPKIKDIAFLGEDLFFLGCNLLTFSKDNLSKQDKINLKDKTNFDILMSIINDKNVMNTQRQKMIVEYMFTLLFPQHQLLIMPTLLVLNKQIDEEHKQQSIINNSNFEQFRSIIKQMFCLDKFGGNKVEYNPANKLAQQIANKLRERHKKLSQKQSQGPINILSRYISILALGNTHTIPELFDYTVFQLFDQFNRFQKKYSYDIFLKAKMAGAQKLQEVENWMTDEEDKVPQIGKSKLNRQIQFDG